MKQTIILLVTSATLALANCGRPANTTLMERGDYAMWQSRWADAATNYSTAIDQHPGDWEAQYKLGQCYLEMGEPLKASHSLAIAESIQPKNDEIANLYATALMECGDKDGLFSYLQNRAQTVQTEKAWTKFAEYAMVLDDPDSATSAINTAIAIGQGKNETPYIIAASFAERLGDDDLALKRWKEAWYINPSNNQAANALRSYGEVPGPTMTGNAEE